MNTNTTTAIEELYNLPENGEAEIVKEEIIVMSPTGGVPGRAGGEIYISLREYERKPGHGYAFPNNVGFIVDLPDRSSFSPNAAFYTGELKGGQFLEGVRYDNYIKDESRSLEGGLQEQASNHLKRL